MIFSVMGQPVLLLRLPLHEHKVRAMKPVIAKARNIFFIKMSYYILFCKVKEYLLGFTDKNELYFNLLLKVKNK